MGAGGLAAAVVLGAAALLVLVLLAVGLSLFAIGVAGSRRWAVWTGGAITAVVVVAIAAVALWIRLSADPHTLRLDLREPVPAAELGRDDTPAFPGIYDFDSERLEIVLPDGREFAAEAYALTVHVDDGFVSLVSLRHRTVPWSGAAAALREWAATLDLEPGDLPPGSAWERTVTLPGVEITLRLTPVGSSGSATVAFRVVPGTDDPSASSCIDVQEYESCPRF